MTRSRRAPDGGNGYWVGWGAWGDDRRFELTNGQTFDATSAILLCREHRAAVVCLTNTQWDGEPGSSARLADALTTLAMDAIVPGCSESFERARVEHEAQEAARVEAQQERQPMEVSGRWVGTIDLAGRALDAALEVTDESSATLRFGAIAAIAEEISVAGITLQADFECEGEMEVLGETSPVSYVSMTIRRVADGRLAGSTIFGLYDDARTVVGTAPALTSFTRAP